MNRNQTSQGWLLVILGWTGFLTYSYLKIYKAHKDCKAELNFIKGIRPPDQGVR